METEYPHIIVRLMPAMYSRCPIIFKDKAEEGEEPYKIRGSDKPMIILNSCPYTKTGRINKKARAEIISATLSEVKRIGFRMCVVFSKSGCVYCEPDGSTEKSSESPNGVTRICTKN